MPIALAPREKEYVECLKHGMNDKEAAREMHCNLAGILSTAKRARYKLHAKNRTELVINAIRQGFIELSLIICVLAQCTTTNDIERPSPRGRTAQHRTTRTGRPARGSNLLRLRTRSKPNSQLPPTQLAENIIEWTGGEIYQTYDLQGLSHEQNTHTPNHV
jgi:DNA-binding CsgD family transcriptional regulator